LWFNSCGLLFTHNLVSQEDFMRKMRFMLGCVLLLACSGLAFSQAAKAEERKTVTQVLHASVSDVEGEFVPAAEAMPEDKYSFAPTSGAFKGVRTFAQQVKHVAAVNYIIGASILVEKPPVELGGENGPDTIASKADIVKFLKDSFAYLHKAVGSVNEKNMTEPIKYPFGKGNTTRLYMATLGVGHCFDHYGQMVEYLRMNSIIPPASR
jgi:DinB superfamily